MERGSRPMFVGLRTLFKTLREATIWMAPKSRRRVVSDRPISRRIWTDGTCGTGWLVGFMGWIPSTSLLGHGGLVLLDGPIFLFSFLSLFLILLLLFYPSRNYPVCVALCNTH